MQSWEGKNITVKILYSKAGIAQHIWINSDNGAILVDVGDGAIRDIQTNKLDLDQLKGIIFTHGHFDHVGGLHTLLGFLRMIGRKESLQIFMPKGCTEVMSIVDNFIEGYSGTIPFKISCKEVQSHEAFQVADMMVEPYPVVHCGCINSLGIISQIPAMGYRITNRNEIVAVSGDTGLCPSLRKLVKGVDFAILEATFEKSEEVSEEFLNRVHLSEDIAKELGKLAKEFIIIHKGKR